ncbi:vWA domain-containing protein [Oceanispirochaeta sp.]|jgi:hypothetical protein|uniref:vWA domain-containing protein n=1 Tax=Oceanispirochaeta sp. TaxID=2035350 RepID=UPI0026261643|nr:vWA domain-containing protein [Oceanispirochaeta sp.]MDA3957750.1 VWA domain-containing protein [Oceanispirochaeta sp.]
MRKGIAVFIIMLTFTLVSLSSQELTIEPGDVYIDMVGEDGFHLWIRQKPGMNSVLLTESTADPEKLRDSFALRAYEFNEINGNEARMLDGELLPRDRGMYYLIDSSPVYNELMEGMAFQIYVPLQLTYGYAWSREGQLDIRQGTWLNIRAFSKAYADYSGIYQDNPFILSTRIKELPPAVIPEIADKELEDIMEEAALMTGGAFIRADDGDDAVDKIGRIITSVEGGSIDVVLVVDSTVSMKNDINFIQKKLVPLVKTHIEGFDSFRIGIVLYRDYKEAYLTKETPFQTDLDKVQWYLDRITVSGGRDIPEAVYEGIFSGISNYEWTSDHRIIIQVGDASPHEVPKGEITKEMVYREAAELGISIYPILLPSEY